MQTTPNTLVMKFGGTSIGSVDAMRAAVAIIRETRAAWPHLVVVTSALSGVTNLLLEAAARAAVGDLETARQAAQSFARRHAQLIEALISDPIRQKTVQAEINALIDDFTHLCQAMHVLGEASPRALDTVTALGERMSARILAGAAVSAGVTAEAVEATRLIRTDDHFQNALPDMLATTACTRAIILPILAAGSVPIVTGYIAATPAGATTTLGRGGSDYTAAILALALQAADVWIWTDVDGVMTADPRTVPDARTIPVLSYREVAEMAHYGAKVLHPKSIHPVIEAGIGLRVCNTFNPTGPDTRLVDDFRDEHYGAIRAIATIRGLQLVTLAGRGMLGVPGVAARIFSAVATTGVSVPLIIESTSEQAICFPAPQERVSDVIQTVRAHLASEFQRGDIDRITASDAVDIITVICPGLRTTPGVAGQIFGVLGQSGVNVLGISFGASDVSINLIVSAADTHTAVRALHALVA